VHGTQNTSRKPFFDKPSHIYYAVNTVEQGEGHNVEELEDASEGHEEDGDEEERAENGANPAGDQPEQQKTPVSLILVKLNQVKIIFKNGKLANFQIVPVTRIPNMSGK